VEIGIRAITRLTARAAAAHARTAATPNPAWMPQFALPFGVIAVRFMAVMNPSVMNPSVMNPSEIKREVDFHISYNILHLCYGYVHIDIHIDIHSMSTKFFATVTEN
jgi:hypothetical protein